jgi:hypothetical protein
MSTVKTSAVATVTVVLTLIAINVVIVIDTGVPVLGRKGADSVPHDLFRLTRESSEMGHGRPPLCWLAK